jgi:hypothetical protein
MPSAPQNRFCANGRSADTHSHDGVVARGSLLVKVRTLDAHTGVSTLGKM